MKEKAFYEIRYIDDVSGMNATLRYDMDEANTALHRYDRLKHTGREPKIFLVKEEHITDFKKIDPWVALMDLTA